MKLKNLVLGLTLVMVSFANASYGYNKEANSPREASDYLFFQSGEWPLPVRVAPFPIKDVVGGWDLGPGKPVLEITKPLRGPDGYHVDVSLIDKITQEIIANGPGRVVGDVLIANSIRMGGTKIYMQMVSLIPPKSSAADVKQEKMYYMYIFDKQDRSRRAQFRIKKVYDYGDF